MKASKITEGEGYVSGDYECWCIHDIPFEKVQERMHTWLTEEGDEPPESVYPSDMFPQSETLNKKGFDYSKKIRYKVTVEVEHVEDDQTSERKET